MGNVPRETSSELGGIVAGFMADWDEVACAACDRPFMRRQGSDRHTCQECERTAKERERMADEVGRILSRLDANVDGFLRRAGMSPRELTADPARVPPGLRALLWDVPVRGARMFEAGRIPESGFGLVGGAGSGKTFALAVLVKTLVREKLRADIQAKGAKGLAGSWLGWVSWPEAVNEFRVVSTRDGGLQEVHAQVKAMAAQRVLVLDDLGAERLRGNYEDDWAASQLELLVDTRYNEQFPTWWTSNLSQGELIARYGSRLTSRLMSENPAVKFLGPDLRMVKR